MIENVLGYPSLFGGQKHAIADYTHTHAATKRKPCGKTTLLHALFNFI